MATVGQALTAPDSGWRRYDDTDSRILYTGTGWNTSTGGALSGGIIKWCNSTTNKILFKFYGTKIRLICDSQASGNSSSMILKIDGNIISNININSKVQPQMLGAEYLNLPLGVHYCELYSNVMGNWGVDAIDIDSTGYLVHPTLNQVSDFSQVKNVGDCVPHHYKAAISGQVGYLSKALPTDYEIPILSSATPDGSFYWVYIGKDYLGRKKFIADRNIQHSISWDTLNSSGIVNELPLSYNVNNPIVAGWDMKETAGTVAYDVCKRYNGTISGTTIITENTQTFRRFNGVGDTINFTNTVMPIGKKTLRFMYRKTSKPIRQEILFNNHVGSTTANGVYLSFEPDGTMWIIITDGNGWSNVVLSINVPMKFDNDFHTVQFDWDGSVDDNKVRVFIDKVLAQTSTAKRQETKAPSYNLRISGYYAPNNDWFVGDLCNVEVYNDVIDVSTNLEDTNANYSIRLLTGGTSTTDIDNEWDEIIVNSTLGGDITAGDNDIWHWNNVFSVTSTTPSGNNTDRVCRGNTSISAWGHNASSFIASSSGFRPVLLVDQLSFDKFLIKKDSKYYSIRPEHYDVLSHAFKPLILSGGNIPNKLDIDTFAFDVLSQLTTVMVKDSDTFKPIDKLDNTFDIKYYKTK